jgi:hypothetical protein
MTACVKGTFLAVVAAGLALAPWECPPAPAGAKPPGPKREKVPDTFYFFGF